MQVHNIYMHCLSACSISCSSYRSGLTLIFSSLLSVLSSSSSIVDRVVFTIEGGRRSSTALLLLLTLMLAASSSSILAAAQRRPPPTDGSYYTLITVWTNQLGDQCKLAMKADGSSVAGFANNKNNWFAIQGSEDLLQSYRDRYIGGGNVVPGNGLATLLGALVKKNATS